MSARVFQVRFTMYYTRISCMPFRATMEFDRHLRADDQADALRQACLCVDRELDEILAFVNTQNVTGVRIRAHEVREAPVAEEEQLWNPVPFPIGKGVPPYIEIIRQRSQ